MRIPGIWIGILFVIAPWLAVWFLFGIEGVYYLAVAAFVGVILVWGFCSLRRSRPPTQDVYIDFTEETQHEEAFS